MWEEMEKQMDLWLIEELNRVSREADEKEEAGEITKYQLDYLKANLNLLLVKLMS